MTTSLPRLCVVYTGGTIGMRPSPNGLIPDSQLLEQIQSLPGMSDGNLPPFDFVEYAPLLDSTDMQPADWLRIAEDIATKHDDYAGFVVLHGTDTMAYTASALSFFLENLGKPVVVTGSQLPLSHPRTDGARNLMDALWVAAHNAIPEVTLLFNGELFRGNRSTKVSAESFSAFASPNAQPLLKMGIHIRQISATIAPTHNGDCRVANFQSQDIRVFPFFPGASLNTLASMVNDAPDAIILQTFGAGNAPASDALNELLYCARSQQIPVLNISHCSEGCVSMGDYAAGSGLRTAGVMGAEDMTLEAVLAKLHYVLSNRESLSPFISSDSLGFQQDEAHLHFVASLMRISLRGELTP